MFRDFDTMLSFFTQVFVDNLVAKWWLKVTCLAILVKLLLEKESRNQTDITSFFKKADRSKKNDDHIVTDHAQLPPPCRQDMVNGVEKAFNYISNDTRMVSRSFDVCGITTTDSSEVRSGSFYKSCTKNASNHLQNDEEKTTFALWFHTVISLSSLKKKGKAKS